MRRKAEISRVYDPSVSGNNEICKTDASGDKKFPV